MFRFQQNFCILLYFKFKIQFLTRVKLIIYLPIRSSLLELFSARLKCHTNVYFLLKSNL
ncbi:hypothetical protein E2986_13602 [Frieseomelitta varia]|uniref:Uncharacterized protein n=1 Tax=Frieseomelitta varia TaxID=561572 RepID=A0A833RMZ9_9HYME|nr:hypothetical protein E2986_13602 [Frieseomelitta varia]